MQSVRPILNRSREPLDLILVYSTAETNDKVTKAAFFKVKSLCSLSGIKVEQQSKRSLPGQCHKCQSYVQSSKHCFNPARCVKCLGNHGTVQCTRYKNTDGLSACVICKQKGHTANYLRCLRVPKGVPPPRKPRRAVHLRARSQTLSYARAAAGPRSDPPAAKQNQSSTANYLK
ncbi:Nucleic-acid-binding protein from transposon X-element [Eumeta japonica]|uniref:Nucleic-acid-binding protein from transposon X-element n=1 Tax=Eumeta variegata TaxID=151549 RepID=A0A4C1YST3_EUMVA|nr:Nucleic-acid-binding protein from transposon X-element [Eumeta japonica]